MIPFGERIGMIMRRRNLTQKGLQALTGISQATISDVISGNTRLKMETALAISGAIGFHIEDLCHAPDTLFLEQLAAVEAGQEQVSLPPTISQAWRRNQVLMELAAKISTLAPEAQAEAVRTLQALVSQKEV